MNEKQVKLLRYFVKQSGDLTLAGQIKAQWPTLTHKRKGELTSWLKKVIVTLMTVSKEKKRAALEANKKTLANFSL